MTLIEKLKNALGDVEINEEGMKALDEFFVEMKENIEAKIKKEDNFDKEAFIEECELAGEAMRKDILSTFELAGEAMMEDYQEDQEAMLEKYDAAGELMLEDLKSEFSDKLVIAMNEMYASFEEKAKKEFVESDEYKALATVKDTLLPLIENDMLKSETAVEIKNLRSKLTEVNEEKESLKRNSLIQTLVSGLPESFVEDVTKFISKGTSEEDILNRFSEAVSLIDLKIENGENKTYKRKTKIEEDVDIDDDDDDDDEVEEDDIFEEDVDIDDDDVIFTEDSSLASHKDFLLEKFNDLDREIIGKTFNS